MLQIDFLTEILKMCKESGIHTAVDTAGCVPWENFERILPYTDLFLYDMKAASDDIHKQYTGVSNQKILKNLAIVSELGAKVRLRCILVNGVNTDVHHYEGIANVAATVKNLDGVELIPYHAYGGTKATFIGEADNGRPEWIPTAEQMNEASTVLQKHGLFVVTR